MNKLKILVIILFFLAPLYMISEIVDVPSIDWINKGSVFAKVIDIKSLNDSCYRLLVEHNTPFEQNILTLESKWDRKDIKNCNFEDTVKVGKSYIFYIERPINKNDDRTDRSSNFFYAYNLLGNMILPMSQSKLDLEFFKIIANGGSDFILR